MNWSNHRVVEVLQSYIFNDVLTAIAVVVANPPYYCTVLSTFGFVSSGAETSSEEKGGDGKKENGEQDLYRN